MRTRTFFLWVCSFLCCFTLNAQYNVLTSPSINKDGSVTFKLDMPNAQRVVLKGQFQKDSLLMSKNAEGYGALPLIPSTGHLSLYLCRRFHFDCRSGQYADLSYESFKPAFWKCPSGSFITVIRFLSGKVGTIAHTRRSY